MLAGLEAHEVTAPRRPLVLLAQTSSPTRCQAPGRSQAGAGRS